jgi:CelD/BcsL family acetyltransferase involved in cellulose biosynthesis
MFLYVENRFNSRPRYVVGPVAPRPDRYEHFIRSLDAPIMTVPATAEALRALKRKKFWYNIERQKRLFEAEVGPLEIEVLRDDPRLPVFLDKVQALFSTRWRDRPTSSPWRSPNGFVPYRTAMIELARTGEAELIVLHSDGRLLSYGYCLIAGDRYCFYQHCADHSPEFRRYSLGKVLVVEMIRHIVATERCRTLDFMIGLTDYKLEWADQIAPTYYRVSVPRKLRFLPGFFLWTAAAHAWFHVYTNEKLKRRIRHVLERLAAIGPARRVSAASNTAGSEPMEGATNP